jgi:hypothetical protein
MIYGSFIAITYKGDIRKVQMDEEGVTTALRGSSMSAAELKTPETEQERIERWRTAELLRAGYEPAAASLLSARLDVDLHYAIDLLRAGCEPGLALRILL